MMRWVYGDVGLVRVSKERFSVFEYVQVCGVLEDRGDLGKVEFDPGKDLAVGRKEGRDEGVFRNGGACSWRNRDAPVWAA